MSGERPLLPLFLGSGLLLLLCALPAVGTDTGAMYVGAEACFDCHDAAELDPTNVHMRIESFEVGGRNVGCEGCHGPGGNHVESAEAADIRTFAGDGYAAGEACMTCHRTKRLSEWHGSQHAVEDVSCTDCHAIHEARTAEDTCATCHQEEVSRFWMPSRHPVREGKMSCSSCHDVHASSEAMLRTRQRRNDLCFKCHQAQEGPFIFEHAPVQEDCSICHEPHGSVADSLLVAAEPMLCLQCHEFHFHAGYRASDDEHVDVGGFERENPFGAPGFNIAYTTNCTQCHARVHGSDTPAQTVSGKGRGLTH